MCLLQPMGDRKYDLGKFCLKNISFFISKDDSQNEGVLGLSPSKDGNSYIWALKQ